MDPKDAHGESDRDLIEHENSDGGGHQSPDGGGEDRLLNQASNDGESTVSQGLEGTDLSDATREGGVRGVESPDDSARRHEDGGDDHHESDGREEGGQGGVVVALSGRHQFEIESSRREPAGGRKIAVRGANHHAGEGVALSDDEQVREWNPDLAFDDSSVGIDDADDTERSFIHDQCRAQNTIRVLQAEASGRESTDRHFVGASLGEASVGQSRLLMHEKGGGRDSAEERIGFNGFRGRVPRGLQLDRNGQMDFGRDCFDAGGNHDASNTRRGDARRSHRDFAALDAFFASRAHEDDVPRRATDCERILHAVHESTRRHGKQNHQPAPTGAHQEPAGTSPEIPDCVFKGKLAHESTFRSFRPHGTPARSRREKHGSPAPRQRAIQGRPRSRHR